MPDRSPLKSTPRINTTPITDAERKRLHSMKVKPPKLFPPTVQAVKEITTPRWVSRFASITLALASRLATLPSGMPSW